MEYLPALEKEYQFWMNGADTLTDNNNCHRRVVRMPDGTLLNRYWDDDASPRPEAYIEDLHVAAASNRQKEDVYRHIRAAAESGWDSVAAGLQRKRICIPFRQLISFLLI